MTKLLMNQRFVEALQCLGISLMGIVMFLKSRLSQYSSPNLNPFHYLAFAFIVFIFIYGLLLVLKKVPVRSYASPPRSIFGAGVIIGIAFSMFANYWIELARWEREKTETVMQLDQNKKAPIKDASY
jgi:energy-coupling factor transporter transmembrane protein EcfT